MAVVPFGNIGDPRTQSEVQTWTVTNPVVPDRTFDTASPTLAEMYALFYTLLGDLENRGALIVS